MTANTPSTCEPMTARFARLHDGPAPLLLPNAWDLTSALAFVRAGYPAIATTSFGVAASAGRPDGGRTTREANLALATTLRRLPIPLSVDIEDGYHDNPDAVADYVAPCPTPESPVSTSRTAPPTSSSTPRATARKSPRSSSTAPSCSSTREWTPTGSARTPHPSTH